MRFGRTSPHSYLMLAVLLALAPESCPKKTPEPTPQPWVTKDWTEWTLEDCAIVLRESPWASLRSANIRDYPADERHMIAPLYHYGVLVTWRTALPVRLALIRENQIENDYDQMDAAERAAFDARMGAEFGGDGGNIVIRAAELVNSYNGPGRDGQIFFSILIVRGDGKAILPLEVRHLANVYERTEWGYTLRRQMDVVFPGNIDGQPTIPPEASEIDIAIQGHLTMDGFKEARRRKFKLAEMMFKGVVEY